MTTTVKKRKLSPAATAAIGVAAVLVIALAGWFMLVSPQRARAADLDKQIADVDAQIAQARAASTEASNFEPIRAADLFRLSKAMPADNDMSGILLELSRVAGETGIVFQSITPSGTTANTGFRVQPIELVFNGDFYSLSDFLYRLRNLVAVQKGRLIASGRLFAVDKLQFVEGDGGFPQVKAVMTVSAFLYGTGPVAGAPPAAAAPDGSSTSTDTTATTETTSTDTTATTTAETPAPATDASASAAP
jgi:type IV pilus assembly PilO-like protein